MAGGQAVIATMNGSHVQVVQVVVVALRSNGVATRRGESDPRIETREPYPDFPITRARGGVPVVQLEQPEEGITMAKQSSNALSRLASRIMKGAEATQKEIMQLAASVLSQDETKGGRPGARKAKKRKTPAKKRAAKKRK